MQESVLSTRLLINLMGNYCRDLKDRDPTNFPSDQKFEYMPKTSTISLRNHIERLHLTEFLEQAQMESWKVFPHRTKVALDLGYTIPTLLEALKKPGACITNLPPPPRSSQQNLQPDREPQDQGLPPYSIAAFHRYLVRFITADDQVRIF